MLGIILGFIYYIFLAAAIFLILLSILLKVKTDPYPSVKRYDEELSYIDPKSKNVHTFPEISDDFSVNLSVIVPAYNEEERLTPMLDEAISFLEERKQNNPNYSYEIIVVSDGSTDRTVDVAQAYALKYGSDKIRCLKLVANRGKGGAIRLGFLSARGAQILFADADGATKFEDLSKLEIALGELLKSDPIKDSIEIAQSKAIVIGSRAHLEKESLATRSIFRNILMYGFHFLVWLFTVKGIKDTQCGFKLFTRKAGDLSFKNLHVTGWAFDAELLYIAQKLNIPIVEIPVRWTEIDGSKITPVFSWIRMGIDLGLIWLKYSIGAWKIKDSQ